VTERPYHHGDLRVALLDRAEQTLRESGVDGLSLRELARDVGVSHGAPRRHFRDKAALLDSLAVEGFHRLADTFARAAAGAAGRPFPVVLSDVAVAYVTFATENPALLELMFTSKHQAEASAELHRAANSSFDQVAGLVDLGQSCGALVDGEVEQVGMTLFAMLHGITSLANTDMIDRDQLPRLTGYAVGSLLHGLAPRHGTDLGAAPGLAGTD